MYNCIVLRHWKRTYLTPQKPIVNSLALCAICFRRYFLPCESSNEFYHPLDEGFWNLFVNRYAYWFPHCFVIIDVATKIKQSSSGDDGLLFMLWELCVDIPRWLQYLKAGLSVGFRVAGSVSKVGGLWLKRPSEMQSEAIFSKHCISFRWSGIHLFEILEVI